MPAPIRIELRLEDFERLKSVEDLEQAVERLLPVALERLGAVLADQQWEQFYRQLRDAGVRPPPQPEDKDEFVRRHGLRYAQQATEERRELVRQKLRQALAPEALPPG